MSNLVWQTLPETRAEAGEVIITQGQRSNRLFFLRHGTIDVIQNGALIWTERAPGAVFGELSILLGVPHTADVVARDASQLHAVGDPLQYLKDHPALLLHVSRILATRVIQVTQYLRNVRDQFGEQTDHLAMMDEILSALVHRLPGTDQPE